MALKSTIFKAELQLADLDRSHFGDYSLTLARHPSETDERMMVRLLAFALNASETLSFGRGLSAEDEAALKTTRTYGGSAAGSAATAPPPAGHNQFGMIIASCERADLRPLPTGVMIYDEYGARL